MCMVGSRVLRAPDVDAVTVAEISAACEVNGVGVISFMRSLLARDHDALNFVHRLVS